MMYVKPRAFIVSSALSCAAVLTGGWMGYRSLMEAGLKAQAENLLFFALCILGVLAAVIIGAMVASRNAKRGLERAAELTAMSGSLPRERIRKLGALGNLIERLFADLDAASERKTLKIREQDAIVSAVLSLASEPTLLLDARGVIQKANEAFARAYGARPAQGQGAEELFPKGDLKAAMRETARTGLSQELDNPGGPLQLRAIALAERPPAAYSLIVGEGRIIAGMEPPAAGIATRGETDSLTRSLQRISSIFKTKAASLKKRAEDRQR